MIQYLIEGVMLGLTLTCLLGPIFVALTQTGVKHGLKAGIAVGAGIWISDIIVIIVAYIFILNINQIIKSPDFQFWMGMAGGIILICSGIITFLKSHETDEKSITFNARSYLGFFSKGFAVNFINPFTFIFWISVMTSYVSVKGITSKETIALFGSIMITIMITDSLKVMLAKAIRSKMKIYHINIFNKLAGVVLIIFGIILMLRSDVI